jgi:hypothetical protein
VTRVRLPPAALGRRSCETVNLLGGHLHDQRRIDREITVTNLGHAFVLDLLRLAVKADDQVASRIPSARIGSVEVRPLHDSHQQAST